MAYPTANDVLADCWTTSDPKFDSSTLRDNIGDSVSVWADNACTYTSDCFRIIDDFESDYGDDAMDVCSGQTFNADQYREAATAYAYCIMNAKLNAEAYELVDEIEALADDLIGAVNAAIGPESDLDADDLTITDNCPHGWASHDREEHGLWYWTSGQIDGMNSIAADAGPFWLSYTWQP